MFMNKIKMSLVAALLVSANVYAVENIKVAGDAKLFYETFAPTLNSNKLFEKTNANGQVGVDLAMNGDFTDSISFGTALSATDTLGLENNLVSGVWTRYQTYFCLDFVDIAFRCHLKFSLHVGGGVAQW